MLVKKYDILKPTRCLIEENQRYLRIEQEDTTTYVAYFTINSIVGELDFLIVKFLLPATAVYFPR